MKRIRVALFPDRSAAATVQERLQHAGIPVNIHEGLGLARLWFVSKSTASVRLEVPAEREDQARQLLLAWDASEGALSRAVRCPECGSLRVDFPQFARRSLLTNLALGLVAELGLVKKEYYCQYCHCLWPRPGETPVRPRRHTAPQHFLE
jgi:hypothetical protein